MITSKLVEKLTDSTQRITIAIDGTAGSGKGTLAKLLAEKFDLIHCQTSLFYRSLAFKVLNIQPTMSNAEIVELSKSRLPTTSLPHLYTSEVTEMTSIIAAIPEVRENLKKPQQDFLLNNSRVVMEGRDIGTVIAPNADLKLFITADLDARAERRYKQMKHKVPLDKIRQDIEMRDLRDRSRDVAPLSKADDGIEVDTTYKSPEEIIEWLLSKGRN